MGPASAYQRAESRASGAAGTQSVVCVLGPVASVYTSPQFLGSYARYAGRRLRDAGLRDQSDVVASRPVESSTLVIPSDFAVTQNLGPAWRERSVQERRL